jgi:hypothetical protein
VTGLDPSAELPLGRANPGRLDQAPRHLNGGSCSLLAVGRMIASFEMRMRASMLSGLAVVIWLGGCSSRTLDPNGPGVIVRDGGGGAGAGSGTGAGGAAGQGAGPARALGQPCARAAECGSGFCAGGVCCNAACTEACKRCDFVGSEGVCTNMPPGVPPRWATACPATPVSTCGLDGKCDGDGTCRFHFIRTVCAPGACDGDAVVGQKICDGRGTCLPGPTVICAPYTCDPAAAACRQSCATDQECVGTYCEPTGRCHVNSGARCTRNTDCASGFCADGVCCNTACSGNCVSCDVAGHQGICWPRPDLCPGADAATD